MWPLGSDDIDWSKLVVGVQDALSAQSSNCGCHLYLKIFAGSE